MSNVSVVPVGSKRCKPFIREVFVASPEAGYKFELIVEQACSKANDPLWKLVFDLYRKEAGGDYQQLVHVSFTPEELAEQRGVAALATEPVNVETARILLREVHPCAKEVANSANPTPEQTRKLESSMSKVALTAADV